MRFWLPALVAMAVLHAGAHHPFTPFYDASKPTSITGQIVELRVVNPHIVLVSYAGAIRDPEAVLTKVRETNGVVAAEPLVYSQVMLTTGQSVSGVVVP